MRRRTTDHVESGLCPHIFDEETRAADEQARDLLANAEVGPSQDALEEAAHLWAAMTGKPISRRRARWSAYRFVKRRTRDAKKGWQRASRTTRPVMAVPTVAMTGRREPSATGHCAAIGRSRSSGRASSTAGGSDPDSSDQDRAGLVLGAVR